MFIVVALPKKNWIRPLVTLPGADIDVLKVPADSCFIVANKASTKFSFPNFLATSTTLL